jgi:hypothetical protein
MVFLQIGRGLRDELRAFSPPAAYCSVKLLTKPKNCETCTPQTQFANTSHEEAIMEIIEQHSGSTVPRLRSGKLRVKTSGATKEICLDRLSKGDLLLIRTTKSVYSFIVGDPQEKCGWLTGGRLGETGVAAVLVGAQSGLGACTEFCRLKLSAGKRVVFIVNDGTDSTRLMTSAITSLTHINATVGHPITSPSSSLSR